VQHFDGQRDTLAAADAKRDKTARETVPPHRVDEFGGKHRAGRADGVTMSDSAAFDVDDVLGQSEFAGNHNGDGRECLIDLDALDGVDVPAGPLQRLPDCRHWSEAEHAGLDRGDTIGDKASDRREAALLGP